MAKLYKIEMYVLDVTETYSDLEEIIDNIESKTDIYMCPFNSHEVQLMWHDDIDINKIDCSVENYRKYFECNK